MAFSQFDGTELAIVGMAGRFPGARNVNEFWRNLCDGVESIRFLTDKDLDSLGVDPALRNAATHVRAVAMLDDPDHFDAGLFGIQPREAEMMDPQQRVFLECAWEALEHAGYDSERFKGSIGVYGGATISTYLLFNLASRLSGKHRTLLDEAQISMGNAGDFLTTRVSYKLNLTGPSHLIQTACSTSLVAVHVACQSLLTQECDMALAGGVSIGVNQRHGYVYQKDGIASPDGHCRAFDARAQGTIFGSGAGIVVLRRLEDALADGDYIHAVIRGSAINNDGARKVGYTAPSVEGQARVITEALANAGVSADSISYIEAHGTGTALGDPIEMQALTRAFRTQTERNRYCAIGSVKTNIGHLDVAAGCAGLIKTVLALQHKQQPPTLHFEQPNPHIDFDNSPFYPNTKLVPWEGQYPRRAGVSSFGIGGTNAHAIIEEAPPLEASGPSRPWQLLLLSGRSASVLERATANLAAHLNEHPGLNLADVAFTYQTGRRVFEHRRAVVCRDVDGAMQALESCDPRSVTTGVQGSGERPVAFMFPGHGSQYPSMARGLYESEPEFRDRVDRCAEMLQNELGCDLRSWLYPAAGEEAEAERQLKRPSLANPALFVTEYALANLWISSGIQPQAMIGHSLGEYVAACVAGVFSLEDALALVAYRGRLLESLPAGSMLSLALPEEQVRALLGNRLSIAAVNGPTNCVVSGPVADIEAAEALLAEQSIQFRRLQVDVGYHSSLMDPVMDKLANFVSGLSRRAPALPFISSATGKWITPSEATDPQYWARHLRETVRFSEGIQTLMTDPQLVLLEVGPGSTLTSLARMHATPGSQLTVVMTVRHPKDPREDAGCLLDALGKLWVAGVPVSWERFYARERRQRLPLPTYPFERRRYWLEGMQEAAVRQTALPTQPQIVQTLKLIVSERTGTPAHELDPSANFFRIGLDSLALVQASHAIKETFGVEVSLQQLFEELNNLNALAAYIDGQLPAEPAYAAAASDTLGADMGHAVPDGHAGDGTGPAGLTELFAQQLHLMSQQLELLRMYQVPQAVSTALDLTPIPAVAQAGAPGAEGKAEPAPFSAYQALRTEPAQLSPRQQRHLDALLARYTAKTAGSKERIEASRFIRANHRNIMSFRSVWKEMIYPIISPGSRGSRITDVNGNEYIDLTMGFGVNLFGHGASFITDAVAAQLKDGMQVGPYAAQADKVAELITELTGVERVAFFNSGTESVMVALRLARAATGKSKIALFAGSFHGTFDGILAAPDPAGGGRSVPMAPGVSPNLVKDVLVLSYGNPQSLEILRAHADDLAAVLVEPVQSRRPDLQPREFLKQLRQLCTDIGAALIFDEVITGFRLHPGGAQAWYGVQADLVTYGKVIGGGMPIGVVAGKATFMDGIDAGMWRYGDASYPPHGARRTLVGGTFCEHPLTMAAALAVLNHLKEHGPGLQQRLNERTAYFAETLNAFFQQERIPMRIAYCGSMYRFVFHTDLELFYYHLIDRGLYTWEGRSCFIATAHTDEDIAYIIRTVKEVLLDMREGGFLPDPPSAGGGGGSVREVSLPATLSQGDRVTLSISEDQRQLWFLTQMSDEASAAYTDSAVVRMEGDFDPAAMHWALQSLVDRHEALRTAVSPDGDAQEVLPEISVDMPLVDWSDMPAEARKARRDRWVAEEVRQPFRMAEPPLLRARIIRWSADRHDLLVVAHHMVMDGWSWLVMLNELAALYSTRIEGRPAQLPPLTQYRQYLDWQAAKLRSPEAGQALVYWQSQLSPAVSPLELPTDRPRSARKTYAGGRLQKFVQPELYQALQQLSRQQSCSLFMTLLAAFEIFLYRLTNQQDFTIALPVAGQPVMGASSLIGHCTNVVPLRSRVAGDRALTEHLSSVAKRLLELFKHQSCSFAGLAASAEGQRALGTIAPATIMFNMDRAMSHPEFSGLETVIAPGPIQSAKFDLFLNVMEVDGALRMDLDYNSDLFEAATCERWMGAFETLLQGIVDKPAAALAELPLLSREEQAARTLRHEPCDAEGSGPWVHQAFEAQVGQSPERLCLIFDGGSLTYGEVNRRANQLARHLRGLGVGPGTAVGLCLEPSWMMAVGLLAALKAGGSFEVADHRSPRNAQLVVWVSDTHHAAALLDAAEPVICLDADWPDIAKHRADDLAADVAPDAPAAWLTVATAGSGHVCVTHAGLARHAQALQRALQLTAASCLAVWAPSSTFRAAERVLAALAAGARLLLTREPESLAEYTGFIRDWQVTTVDLSIDLWRLLAHEAAATTPDARVERAVVNGSCLLQVDLRRGQQAGLVAGTVLYAYQPERMAVTVAVSPVTAPPGEAPSFRKVLVGAPLASTALSILDIHRQPVPAGVPGELHLQFGASSPYHPTGELARYVSDTEMEILGPAEREVRVRGHQVRLNDVEAALHEHPAVREAVVIAADDAQGADKRVIAYVAPHAGIQPGEGQRWDTDHSAHWQMLFNEAFGQGVFGWNSRLTRQAIPQQEVDDIVRLTANRILGLKPQRVLEIGCGFGMILFPVAERVESYHGTDFAAEGIGYIRERIATEHPGWKHVHLAQRLADDFTGFEAGSFDTVIVNGVVQYFQGMDYLLRVLTGAISVVKPGGRIFVGEVPTMALMEIFHAGVALANADDSLPLNMLKGQIWGLSSQEKELFVLPSFFTALQHHCSQVSRVEFQLKRGPGHNDITRFRYDVVLHIGAEHAEAPPIPWRDWQSEGWTLETLKQHLVDSQCDVFAIRGVPNARLRDSVRASELIRQNQEDGTVGELRAALRALPAEDGVNPEDLWGWAEDLPYEVDIFWAGEGTTGRFDVLFRRRATPWEYVRPDWAAPATAPVGPKPWHKYANNPLLPAQARALPVELRSLLFPALPEHYLPSVILVMSALPRRASGQVDTAQLPVPVITVQSHSQAGFEAPRDATQLAIAEMWAGLFGVDKVGIHENFFDLGGQSLIATQMLSRLRDMFNVDLPLRIMFEATTVAKMAELLHQGGGNSVTPQVIERRGLQSGRLSRSQRRLWFMDQLGAEATYNMFVPARLTGPLNVAALGESLSEIVRRHEALRMTFAEVDGEPVQMAQPAMPVAMPVIDLSDLAEQERESEVHRLATQMSRIPFDLSQAPLIRAVLFRLSDTVHVLLLTMHHIASDGWSIEVLLREMTLLYQAASLQLPNPLPQLPIQYSDYAMWQDEWLQTPEYDRQLAYWKEQLHAPAVLELPYDHPRPAVQSFRGAIHRFELPRDLSMALRRLSQQENTTILMTMLATFQALMHLYSGQDDVLLGTPSANRNHIETEGLIGIFVNVLVIRSRFADNPTFRQLLGRTRDAVLGAYEHKEIPFEHLVDTLVPHRDPSVSPLFQVMFAFYERPRQDEEFSGLKLRVIPVGNGTSKVDLSLLMEDYRDDIAAVFEYNTDLFESETIERMTDHYLTFLRNVVEQPDTAL